MTFCVTVLQRMKTLPPPPPAKRTVISRKLHGWAVTFYKRGTSDFYTYDFGRGKSRVQKVSDYTQIKDAEWQAAQHVKRWVDEHTGKTEAEKVTVVKRGPTATVSAVELAMESGDKLCEDRTQACYLGSLRRLAAVVNSENPRGVSLDQVLSRENLLAFYAAGQNTPGRVNRVDKLPENCGLNTAVRNVRSLFSKEMVSAKFAALKLPDLTALRDLFYLPEVDAGFDPWSPAVYDAMEQASQHLRELRCDGPLMPGMLVRTVYQPRGAMLREMGDKMGVLLEMTADGALVEWVFEGERLRYEVELRHLRAVDVDYTELWLVNTMLRRLGLRSAELLAARGEWIEQRPNRQTGELQWVLSLRDRPDFNVLKHGTFRNLVVDEELLGILRKRKGFLIAPDLKPAMREELVQRLHNTWLRQFIPDRAKGNHELRMWAGSIVYMRDGLAAAAYFLGHKSQITTERFYAKWFTSAPALDGQAVALSHVATAA